MILHRVMNSKKSVLITGGAGFIGTHLCRALLAQGHSVRSMDIKDPKDAVAGVDYRKGDVRRSEDLRANVQGVDAVYHFAAIVNVAECQEKPAESYQTNLSGTIGVLEAVREEMGRRGTSVKVIFASTAAVYGRMGQEGIALRESDVAAEPLSYYAAQKLASEHAIHLYHEHLGVPAVVFRFFNVFGPGQDPTSPYSGVITIFSRLAREGKNLGLNGGGYQTRDFISVQDIAAANVKALELPVEKCDGRAINLGTGAIVTIRQLGETLLKISGSKADLMPAAPRPGDVPHSRADASRAQEVLGWKAKISLEEGLKDFFQSG